GIDSDSLLHIRIFDSAGVRTDTLETKDSSGALHLVSEDASGTVLSDVLESSLPAAQADAIRALKQQLPGWLPPHVLTSAEKDRVLSEVTSITGQTPTGNQDFTIVGTAAGAATSITGNGGNNQFTVAATGGSTTINTGSGSNRITVGSPFHTLSPIA